MSSQDIAELTPICVWCGQKVVWDAHEARAWTHWNGPTFCREPGSRYTATPVTRATPTEWTEP